MALIVQSKFGAWAHNFTATVTLDAPATAGHTIILALSIENPVTLTPPAGYTLLETALTRTDGASCLKIYYKTAAGGEQVITAALDGRMRIAAFEVAGTIDAWSKVDHGGVNLYTFPAATLTPTNPGVVGVILAFWDVYYQDYNVGTLTPDGSLVELNESYDGSRLVAWAGDLEDAALDASYDLSITSTVRPGDNNTENTWGSVTVVLVGPLPVGIWVDWDDDGFGTSVAGDGSLARGLPEASAVSDDITSDAIEFTWNRGGTPDLAGGATPGSCTITLKNATKKYNPDNTASALYGKLRPGRPVWIGVNGDGSMVETAGQTVYGVFAGRIREIAPRPLEQTCEIICDDPPAHYRRTPVRLAGSTTRSQAAYRLAIMGVIGEPAERLSLPAESAMLPLSSLDTTDALAALDELNKATGTRHYAEPSAVRDTWYVYTARDRHYHLGGTPDATIDFGSDRVVSIDGYRVTEESVTNIQKTTIAPVSFPLGAAVVWMHVQVPLTVVGNVIIWAEFADYVAEASLEVTSTGAAVTSTLTSFGATAKIELYSTGAQIQRLVVVGKLAIREPSVSYVAEDEPSKAAYGSRAGGEITSDLFGGQAEAKGLADHTIWRYAQPLTRPAITLRGAPVATALRELYDMVAVTSSALSVTARRFDIVGISGTWRTATATVADFEVTWQLSESPLQTSRIFFTIGTSVIDGPDVIGY